MTQILDFGPGCGIRTHGLLVPNQARYQTSLSPDMKLKQKKEFLLLWSKLWSKSRSSLDDFLLVFLSVVVKNVVK